MTSQLVLDPVIVAHVAAVNSFDVDAIMDTFAENALVNDFSREFWGREHIRAWIAKEMAGDHVTLEPVEVVENAGMWCVRCRFNGDYDKTGAAPRELGRIKPIVIPAAEVAVTTYHGPPADIDLAYAVLGSYIAEHELTVGWQLREYYHRDHSHTTDHTQWQTEIAWPIIESTSATPGTDARRR